MIQIVLMHMNTKWMGSNCMGTPCSLTQFGIEYGIIQILEDGTVTIIFLYLCVLFWAAVAFISNDSHHIFLMVLVVLFVLFAGNITVFLVAIASISNGSGSNIIFFVLVVLFVIIAENRAIFFVYASGPLFCLSLLLSPKFGLLSFLN